MQFCAVSLSLSFCFCLFVCLPCVFVAQSRQSAATPARPLRLSHFILLCIARHLYSCAQCREHVLLCCVVLCCAAYLLLVCGICTSRKRATSSSLLLYFFFFFSLHFHRTISHFIQLFFLFVCLFFLSFSSVFKLISRMNE